MPEPVVPERFPLTVSDLARERLTRLHELLPGAFVEGKLVPERLAELVGAAVLSSTPERYGLSYAGRAEALREMLAPSLGALRPDRAASVAWEATENLIIEGDNLHVLKLLQSAYAGAVKLIYIDPPYNTGNDFVYPDDFRRGLAHYKEQTQQTLNTNAETSGRYHSDWLKMMHPRLALARNLLRNDGVIFVSIDDHEVQNLRLLMDEVFGEENFIGEIIWRNVTDNNPTRVTTDNEFILVYARRLVEVPETWKSRTSDAKETLLAEYERLKSEGLNSVQIQDGIREFIDDNAESLETLTRYKFVDDHGVYTGSESVHNPRPGGYCFDVEHPVTRKKMRNPANGYRFPEATFREMERRGEILYGEDENRIVKIKKYLADFEDALRSVITLDGRLGSYDLKRLFEEAGTVFTNPKPTQLLKQLFSFALGPDDLVLDFFAGSGTTGQAVLELNRQDGGNRKFILVQFPEPTGRTDFPTIADITRERVRRVIARRPADLLDRRPEGFRAYRLDESNFKLWDGAAAPRDAAGLERQLELMAHNVVDGRTDDDLLAELLLKCGHPGVTLSSPVEVRTVAGLAVHLFAEGRFAVCLSRELTREGLRGIVALAPKRLVCLEVGFQGDDELKTNIALELKSHGIQFQTV